jgi:hypothetical protein
MFNPIKVQGGAPSRAFPTAMALLLALPFGPQVNFMYLMPALNPHGSGTVTGI